MDSGLVASRRPPAGASSLFAKVVHVTSGYVDKWREMTVPMTELERLDLP
jgi:hypothetical protein